MAHADKLNDLTKNFYESCAKHWNNTPEYEWAGWPMIRQYLPKEEFSVLDLGCGSGRFGHYLGREFGERITKYTAVDYTTFYTNLVRENPIKFIRSQEIFQLDLFSKPWHGFGPSNVVVAFGLIHHLPQDMQEHFFTELYKKFTSETIGIFTTWQYLDNPRLAKKILPDHALSHGERGNILNWTQGTYGERYSHHWDIEEVIDVGKRYGFYVEYLPAPSKREQGLNKYFLIKKLPKDSSG